MHRKHLVVGAVLVLALGWSLPWRPPPIRFVSPLPTPQSPLPTPRPWATPQPTNTPPAPGPVLPIYPGGE